MINNVQELLRKTIRQAELQITYVTHCYIFTLHLSCVFLSSVLAFIGVARILSGGVHIFSKKS